MSPPSPPLHTDRCIDDARQYGFCEHTRLRARSTRPPTTNDPTLTRRRLRRELLAWVGLVLVIVPAAFLMAQLGWRGFVASALLGLGWLLLYLVGLPQALTRDLAKVLPPDARERAAARDADPDSPRPPRYRAPSD